MRPSLYAASLLAFALQGPSLVASFPAGKVEALGACDVRPESVACWDMDGKPSAETESAIRAFLSNGNEVSFRLGKKNRFLVLRRPQALALSYRMGASANVYASSTYNGDPVLDFVRVAVDPAEKKETLTTTATSQSPSDVDVPFHEGAKSTIEGRTLEIGPSVSLEKGGPRPSDPYGRPAEGLAWTTPMSLSGDPNGGYWQYTPLDVAGEPIRYVDAKGQPITALKALSLEPTLQPGGSYGMPTGNGPTKPRKAAPAAFQGGYGGAFRATTNIDPKAIAKLRIRASHTEAKDLGPFPLDPR